MTSSTLREYLHPLDEVIERAVNSVGEPGIALARLRGEWMTWRADTLRAQKVIRGENETAPGSGESTPTPLRSI